MNHFNSLVSVPTAAAASAKGSDSFFFFLDLKVLYSYRTLHHIVYTCNSIDLYFLGVSDPPAPHRTSCTDQLASLPTL